MYMKVRVRQGDTFWLYSQMFRIPVQLIEDSNPEVSPTSLLVGQTINIPGYVIEEYTIQQGDTIWKLARERNLAMDTIFLLNPNINPNQLQINERILLPKLVTSLIVDGNEEYDFAKLKEDINRLVEIYPFLKFLHMRYPSQPLLVHRLDYFQASFYYPYYYNKYMV